MIDVKINMGHCYPKKLGLGSRLACRAKALYDNCVKRVTIMEKSPYYACNT